MNVRERCNALSDIPGFDATKGERINKALQRLWAKIENLERIRTSERKNQSKEVQTSSNEEELGVTDIQFMLLVLQIRYARSILKRKLNSCNTAVNKVTSDQAGYQRQKNAGDCTESPSELPAFQTVCQETQTGNSLIEGIEPHVNDFCSNSNVSSAQASADNPRYIFDDGRQSGSSSRTVFVNPKPHYHLKLDDVPFILGASSSASHSVVANLQNIIAMMKNHNKALCGPRYNQKVPVSKSNIPDESTQDTSKMLNMLAQELKELAQKQKKLDQQFDSAQKKSSAYATNKDSEKNKDKELLAKGRKRFCSSSEVTKIQAEMDSKEQYVPGQRLAVKNQSSNLSVMARRKLLRSLQNFKTHLSAEDISWK